MWIAGFAIVAGILLWLRFKPGEVADSTDNVSVSALRNAVTTAGGTPASYTTVGLLRQLITTWGGTPTKYTVNDLLKQAIIAAGGTPTQHSTVSLLRELIALLGGTPSGYGPDQLWAQLAALANIPVTGAPHGPVVAVGTLLSAPTLDYPSPLASSPYTLGIHLPPDAQSGDVLKLAYSASANMSSPTILVHTITDSDINGSPGTPISIGLPVAAAIRYHQAYLARSGVDSTNKSGIVAWGDTTAPTITTSATHSASETLQIAVTLAATDGSGVPALVSDGTSPGWLISGGADQLQLEVAIVGGVPKYRWVGNGSQNYSNPADQSLNNVYDFIVKAIDYGGNASTLAIAETVLQADLTPDAFSWTNVSNATQSTLYTAANTWTVAGLGIPAALSATGSIRVSTDGGSTWTAWGSPPSTVDNGHQIQAQVNSSSAYSTGASNAVTVGTLTATFTVTTLANPSAASFTPSASQPAVASTGSVSSYTFTSQALNAGTFAAFIGWLVNGGTVNSVSLVPAGGGTTVNCTRRMVSTANQEMSIWTSNSALSAGNYDVTLTYSIAQSAHILMHGSLTNIGSAVPSDTCLLNDGGGHGSPHTAADSLTLPASGVGVVLFVDGTQASGATANLGSIVASKPNYYLARTTASGTPSFNSNSGETGIIGASWGP